MITLKIDDNDIKRLLDDLSRRLDDMSPAMRAVAHEMKNSVLKNFEAEGRPRRWKPSKRALREHGKTLQDKGRLAGSFSTDHGRNYAEVGTSVEYAPTHQFGARKGEFGRKTVTIKAHRRKVKSRDIRKGRRLLAQGVAFVKEHQRIMEFPWGDIPARPFMVVPDEDMEDIKDILVRFILK